MIRVDYTLQGFRSGARASAASLRIFERMARFHLSSDHELRGAIQPYVMTTAGFSQEFNVSPDLDAARKPLAQWCRAFDACLLMQGGLSAPPWRLFAGNRSATVAP